MDWFERLTGFREGNYEDARRQLEVNGQQLQSRVNGRSYGVGDLELVSLQDLRARAGSDHAAAGRLRFDQALSAEPLPPVFAFFSASRARISSSVR